MNRKMQSKATFAVLPMSDKVAQLVMDSVAIVFVAAITLMVLLIPVYASEPLTVSTEALPANFQKHAADAGLDVVGIERLMSLGSHIVTVQSIDGDAPERLLGRLNATFPHMQFVMMNGTDEMFELIEN